MSERDRIIEERMEASAADLLENGPRLTTARESYVLARGDGQVLLGGLGGMGLGAKVKKVA